MGYVKKVSKAFWGRTGAFPAFLDPLDEKTVHPVYMAHAKILQPLTKGYRPSCLVHTIGRPNPLYLRCGHKIISEVEGAAGVSPKEMSKYSYRIEKAVAYTDSLIRDGRLVSIIYQSKSAFDLHKKYASKIMNDVSEVVTQVPDFYDHADGPVSKRINLLVVASNPMPKGLFMLEPILRRLGECACRVNVTVITSKPFEIANDYGHDVKCIVVHRMDESFKKEIFHASDFLLNVSPMDTLGTFLDSMKYGIPVISVRGQHADSYVKDGVTGYILDSPVFYYGEKLGVDYFDVKNTFTEYVLSRGEVFWQGLVEQVVAVIDSLNCSDVDRIKRQHAQYVRDVHTVSAWKNSYKNIYEKFS